MIKQSSMLDKPIKYFLHRTCVFQTVIPAPEFPPFLAYLQEVYARSYAMKAE